MGLGFMLKEINRLVNKRHHYPSVILTGNIIVLEVGEAGERNGKSVCLGFVLWRRLATSWEGPSGGASGRLLPLGEFTLLASPPYSSLRSLSRQGH